MPVTNFDKLRQRNDIKILRYSEDYGGAVDHKITIKLSTPTITTPIQAAVDRVKQSVADINRGSTLEQQLSQYCAKDTILSSRPKGLFTRNFIQELTNYPRRPLEWPHLGEWYGNTYKQEHKKVNYRFDVTSNNAVNFDEIAKELDENNLVLLVSAEEIKRKSEIKRENKAQDEIKEYINNLKRQKNKAEKVLFRASDKTNLVRIASATSEIKQINEELEERRKAKREVVRPLEYEHFILVHPKLATKVYALHKSCNKEAEYLVDLFINTPIDSAVDTIAINRDEIHRVKEALQAVIDAPWGVGYKASVEVKCLL